MKVIYTLLVIVLFGISAMSSSITFKKKAVTVGSKTITVEIADSPERQSHGLMYRKELNDEQGMLFIYGRSRTLSFWMKNTYIDLSIGFFDKSGVLLQVLDMRQELGPVPDNKRTTYHSEKPAKYALEVPMGWFKRKGIALGDKLNL